MTQGRCRWTTSMPKPQWLKDREAQAQRLTAEPELCCDCIYYGPPVGYAKHKGKERVEVHECDIHPNCLNTKYSLRCGDFVHG